MHQLVGAACTCCVTSVPTDITLATVVVSYTTESGKSGPFFIGEVVAQSWLALVQLSQKQKIV